MVIMVAIAAAFTLYYCGVIVLFLRGLQRCGRAGEPYHHTFSVVVAARNEGRNIRRCLDHILAQTIPAERYEVIVVDDRSADATPAICADYSRRHPNLRVIRIEATPPGVSPKKHAVTQGVHAARNAIVVFTDADCAVRRTWLETIDRYFDEGCGVAVGITTYSRPDRMNRFFWGMQAIDFLSHGVVAAAAIGAGIPLNSNANNFAFRKAAFDDVGGYGADAGRVVSGDDDLLLQRIAASPRWRVRYMTDAAGAVTTEPTATLWGVFEQRKRWGSKTVNYSPRQVALLSGIFLFYCGIVAALVAGCFYRPLLLAAAAMILVKIAGELALLFPGTSLFGQKELRRYILPASLVQVPVVIGAVLFGVFGRFTWKGDRFGRTVG